MKLVYILCSVVLGLLSRYRPVLSSPLACTSSTFHDLLSGTVVLAARYYEAGERVNISNPLFSIDTADLPAFCQVQLAITTNATANSTAHTDVWLPESWNQRFLAFGNAGFGGGVNVADLGFIAIEQGYAGMSTDTGHSSSAGDGSWGGPHNDNAIIDWSWRALHLSIAAGKQVVQQYYGSAHRKAYYLGCSTGGRQGLLEAQRFPDDFDGIIVGSPANNMAHLQAWSIHMGLNVRPINSSHWIPGSVWTDVVHPEVLKQCDHLDGVVDGIINDPRLCNFRLETLACRPSQNVSTCLSVDQIDAAHQVYADYYETNQTYIFGGYNPGGELAFPGGLIGEQAYPTDYYRYFVYNDTTWTTDRYDFSAVLLSEKIDPGMQEAVDPNISEFVGPSRNGKLLQYVGWADQLIATGYSLHYYETVHAYMNANTQLHIDDYYRLFTVPGMFHCQGGNGANAFGGAMQAASGTPPSSFDPEHNVLAAMVRWVENGTAPDRITATYWNDNNSTNGVGFTRPICKYPNSIQYKGGDPNVAQSFQCV